MNTVCASCHTTNRLPEARIDDRPNCGNCGEPLFTGEVTNANATTLDKLLQDDLPVVIDFWAPWCGPCVSFAPVFASVAQQHGAKIRFVKVNTESEPALSAHYRIRTIPTLMLFKQGKLVDTLNGALPKAQFENWLTESL